MFLLLSLKIITINSVVFKNNNYKNYFAKSGKYKQAGDWLFYVNVMKEGKIAFINKPYNFYRVHGNNVTSLNKKQAQLNEIKMVHKEIGKMYKLTKKQKNEIEKRYKFLIRVWQLEGDK